MSILEAIILGLVQGIAEFLPISSSGHLAILQNLFNMSDIEGGHMLFDVLLHFGQQAIPAALFSTTRRLASIFAWSFGEKLNAFGFCLYSRW